MTPEEIIRVTSPEQVGILNDAHGLFVEHRDEVGITWRTVIEFGSLSAAAEFYLAAAETAIAMIGHEQRRILDLLDRS